MEQWTQKQAIDYECARECITALIGVYTSQIYQERASASLDQAKIEHLNAEITRLFDERRNLQLTDDVEVSRINSEYGSLVRSAMEAKRSLRAEPKAS